MIGARSDNSIYSPTPFDRRRAATVDALTEAIQSRYRAGQKWSEIEAAIGLSRVACWKRLTRAGLMCDRRRPPARVECERCGRAVVRPFWHAERPIHSYCSHRCYRAWMREQGHSYRQWRQGQRVARQVVARVFPLGRGHVVHHHDGDNRNNALTNLAVFASQSDHMSFHRGGEGLPLWDGRTA